MTIGISSSDATEGAVSPSSLNFTSGNWNTPQVVTVTGVDDAVADGDAAYTVDTDPAVSTDPAYSLVDAANISVTNTDNDTAGITISPTSGLVTTEAGVSDTFTVVLDSQPTANVTIDISSSNESEGTLSISSLTFTSGNWDTSQMVTVTGVDDAVADGDVAYTVDTDPAVSGDSAYSGLDAANVAVTNSDDDSASPPEVSVTEVSPASIKRGDSGDVVIKGSGFINFASVTFENGTCGGAPQAINPDGTITAMVSTGKGPKKKSCTWDVRVTNPDNSTGVLADGFTVAKL